MSDATKAVFLSYAREDADAAKRIADALRAFGVEVWFDQNELRGGDSWDANIRGQIKACALFIPVISATTQSRDEAYFRLEWKLADDRSHLMAPGKPFIVPVVIDGTGETGAAVPESFSKAQWSRLPGALPTPQFVEQVKRLLGEKSVEAGRPRPAQRDEGVASPMKNKPALPGWTWGALTAVVVGIAVALTVSRKAELPPVAAPVIPAPSSLHPSPSLPPSVEAKSIAVLPFANMSEDKEASAFFADGMHEDILTNLAFIRDLRVVSRTSVMQYRNTTKPVSQIAQELKVTYVLEGSVRRAGNKVRVTGQLIRAANDEHVWAKSYDRDISDVFTIQAELAKAIGGALQAVLSPETKALLERRPTDNPAAYDAYLRARQMHNSGAFTATRDTVVLLQRAVELDPAFAAAWAHLGAREAFVYFKTVQTPVQLARAKAAIDRAVSLAPDDPTVVEGLGDYYYYAHRDYVRATEQYLWLAQLRPNDARVFVSLARIQRRQGRISDAIPNFRRAAELDPQTFVYPTDLFVTLIYCRQYKEAGQRLRQFLQANPDNLYAANLLTQVMLMAHGSTEALRDYAAREVTSAERPEHLYIQMQNARFIGNWAEAIRLNREQRYFDGDDDNPRFLQDIFAAATHAEAGDLATAQARATETLTVMKVLLGEQPLNAQLWAAVALAHGLLGARDEAVRCAAKARELLPESRDALTGAAISALCASALAYAGEKEQAIAEFARLLQVPFGANVNLDQGIYTGSWKPLRDDPRFKALLADPKNNQPLF